ncbi:hypothetical protein [Aromatoleum diolicum]|uniref:Uncharacterized protein n=1 Tax=Aromatoleum diolicum TaxID=75796 RepID=A0ABX1QGS4_9RHOO|nr:hypothetical protein [Aromatoleum diolicum]NMG77574.1 hypothetical protein [Aromatoleum diolicum]
MRTQRTSLFGKYRALVFAVATFFVLSVSVNVYSLNFSSLRQVEADATKINDGGKLRDAGAPTSNEPGP